jgi:hypothetical protein
VRSGERRTKRGKDAGRPNSSAIWPTEDAGPRRVRRRRACAGVSPIPPTGRASPAARPFQGPLPAEVTSLATKAAYRAVGTEAPGEARTAYVVPRVDFDKPGPWLAVAIIKGENGLESSRVPSPTVGLYPKIPEVGERAPLIHTPTAADVGGDLTKIDTRVPRDQMHDVDFADAHEGAVDFIHMEACNDNDTNKGIRPQLEAFGLQTEPWTFLIDGDGIVRDRIEGAYGVLDLAQALQDILPG